MFQNIVELVKALAWPFATVWISYLFRTEIRGLFSRMSHLKFHELEANFNEDVSKIEREIRKVESLKAVPQELDTPSSLEDSLHRIAVVSPRAAILEAWLSVEESLRKNGIGQSGFPQNAAAHWHSTSDVARKEIYSELFSIISDMRKVRNYTAHASEFSPSIADAESYVDSAIKANKFINAIINAG